MLTIVRAKFNPRSYHEDDGPGDAEPYLWTVFFKIDGDTVEKAKVTVDFTGEGSISVEFVGTPLVRRTDSRHENLASSDVGTGDDVAIPPAVGMWDFTLRSIPVTLNSTTIQLPGVCGVSMVLMEQDNTPDDAINAGYTELLRGHQAVLSGLAPLLSMGISPQLKGLIEHAVKGVIASNLGFGGFLGSVSPGGNDETIGFKTYIFTQKDLASAPAGIAISQRWTNDDSVPEGPQVEVGNDNGDWEITGAVISSPALRPRLSAEPSTLRFPALATGESSEPRPVTITNEGEADLHVSLVGSSAGKFRWPGLVDTLRPGENRVIDVTFAPQPPAPRPGTQPQLRNGTISLPSDAGSVIVHVSGSVRPGSPL